MMQKSLQRTFKLLPMFGLLFLSSLPSFLGAIWLFHSFVLIQAFIWLIVAISNVWILNKQLLGHSLIENLCRNWFIFPFLLFSGLSILWSVNWEISLARWLILVCVVLTAGYIGLRHDLRKLIEMLSVFGIYILFFCLILIIFFPKIGIMNYYIIQGAWKGIYWHKNHMGLVATFFNLLFLVNVIYDWQMKRRFNFYWGLLYLISLVFVYQSDSVAAIITTLILHGLLILALLWSKYSKHLNRYHYAVFIIAMLFISVILYFNSDQFFKIFNRDSSLTGRIPMWTYLFTTYLSQHPFIGYGFNAFWYVNLHRVTMQLAAGYPDPIVIADNGFIDLLINTGFIGIALFLIFYLGVWWRTIQCAKISRNIIGVFPILLMVYTLVANISWSLIFENESFFMLVILATLFCISSHDLADSQPIINLS